MATSPYFKSRAGRTATATGAIAALALGLMGPAAAFAEPAAPSDPVPCTEVGEAPDTKIQCGDAFYSLHEAEVPGDGEDGVTVDAHAVLESIAPISDPGAENVEYPTSFELPSHVSMTVPFEEGSATYVYPVTEVAIGGFQGENSTHLPLLTEITFAEDSPLHTIHHSAFVGTGITTLTLPDHVTTIEQGAFHQVTSLTSFDFGKARPTALPVNMFFETGLESVDIPDSVEVIGYQAFKGAKLTEVTIPASVTDIQMGAFSSMPTLRSVSFAPDSVLTTIEFEAFLGADLRGTIFLPDTVTKVQWDVFRNNFNLRAVVFTNTDTEATYDFHSNTLRKMSGHPPITAFFPEGSEDLYGVLIAQNAKAITTDQAEIFVSTPYNEQHAEVGRTSFRATSTEIFVNAEEELPEPLRLSVGVKGGSLSTASYVQVSDGDQLTVTSLDGATSKTYTVRINRPVPPEATRHSGVSRFETACELTRAAMDAQTGAFEAAAAPEVVLSSGRSAFDTAIAGAMGAATDRVVLTVDTAEVPECTADLLVDIAPQAVHVIGGTSAVRDTVTDQLDELLPDVQVNRYAGVDRNATAEMVALDLYGPAPMMRTASGTTAPTIVLAAGDRPADVINVATYAAGYDMPVLTIPSDATELPESTLDAIEQLGAGMVMVVGGELAISKGVADQLDELGLWATRIGGKTRYETSANIAEQLTLDGQGRDRAIIANGETFVDAAVAVAHTNTLAGPVVLTQRDCLPGPVHDQVMKSAHMHAVGGTLALGDGITHSVTRCEDPSTDPTPPPTI